MEANESALALEIVEQTEAFALSLQILFCGNLCNFLQEQILSAKTKNRILYILTICFLAV